MPFYTLTVRNDFCGNICVTRLLHVLLFHLQFNSEHDNIDEKLMMRGFEARDRISVHLFDDRNELRKLPMRTQECESRRKKNEFKMLFTREKI
jgi:hypothetical protein